MKKSIFGILSVHCLARGATVVDYKLLKYSSVLHFLFVSHPGISELLKQLFYNFC